MIWVYAICERPDLPPPRRGGLADAPLDGVREGDLLAVISRHDEPLGDPTLESLRVHEQVVERLMADRAVLPMRFGSRLADDDALRGALAARQDEFRAALDRVRGRVEVGVRAMQPHGREAPAPAGTTGREYLEAKLRLEREVAAFDEPLAGLAVEATRQPARAPDEVLRASYLIDAPTLARFRGTVERLQRTHPDVAILCTGPWPPYSFVAPEVGATP